MLKLHVNCQRYMMMLFCALGLSVGVSTACTQSPEIELRGPEKPQQPTRDTTTPSTNEDGNGTSNDTTPGATPKPLPTPVPVTRYRALCDDRYPRYLTAISSVASSTGFGSDLDLQVWPANVALPVQGGFEVEDRNLRDHMFPQTIVLRKGSLLRLAFSATPTLTSVATTSAQRNVYVSDVAIIDRIGRAEILGAEMPVAWAVQKAATQEGFQAKTFGVSSTGRYVLLLESRGVQFFDATTLRALGRVDLKSGSEYFAPDFRESDRQLLVSTIQSGKVATEIFTVDFGSAGQVLKANALLSVSDLRRPLAAIAADKAGRLAGLRSSPSGDTEIVIVDTTSSVSAMTKLQILALPLKGKLASSLAVWHDAGLNELRAAVGFENVRIVGSSFGSRYKIDQAFVRVLNLDLASGKATAIGADYEYPGEAVRTIESSPPSSRLAGIADLQVSSDGKAVFGLFPGSLSYQLYRFTATGFDRMSQEDCTNLSIGVEP